MPGLSQCDRGGLRRGVGASVRERKREREGGLTKGLWGLGGRGEGVVPGAWDQPG